MAQRIGLARGSRPHPFGRATSFVLTPEAIYIGTGESFEIQRYDLTGKLERIMRWPTEDLTIQESHLETYRSAELSKVDAAKRPALERWLAEMPGAASFPAFVRLEVDPSDNLWIEPFTRPGEAAGDWSVVDAEGEFLGKVAIQPAFTPPDIADDVVLGVVRDELGVERVRLYGLTRPEE